MWYAVLRVWAIGLRYEGSVVWVTETLRALNAHNYGKPALELQRQYYGTLASHSNTYTQLMADMKLGFHTVVVNAQSIAEMSSTATRTLWKRLVGRQLIPSRLTQTGTEVVGKIILC